MASTEELKRRIDVAAGRQPADLVIKNCRIVDVFTDEIIAGDIAIIDGFVAAIGEYSGLSEVDAQGRFATPGLIDGHMHLESTMVRPSQFATTAVAHGTLGVIADPHEIANVCGSAGVEFVIQDTEGLPLDVHLMIPSCVPATDFETSGARLDLPQIEALLAQPRVLGLGEMMNYPGVIAADQRVLGKLAAVDAKPGQLVDGHSPWVLGRDLAAYAAAGILTDHECATVQEMIERVRLGMYVQIREGSACRNLDALVPGVSQAISQRVLFCTDDKHPEDIASNGHLDNNIRRAIAAGMDPLTAVRIACLNPARCYGLPHVGAIAPGYRADILLVDSLEEFSVRQVYRNGVLVAEDGQALFAPKDFVVEQIYNSVHPAALRPEDLTVKLTGDQARVISLRPHSVETDNQIETVTVADGCFAFDPSRDILKMAVVERHHASGNVGLALVKGFGLKGGAIASTVGHDSHNIIVIGDSDAAIMLAAAEVERVQGGITVVQGGEVLSTLPLPIAGLMSDLSLPEVEQQVLLMRDQAYAMGVSGLVEPFMTLSFLALPVIPVLKLTDQGLFDVLAFGFTSIDPSAAIIDTDAPAAAPSPAAPSR